SARAYGLHLTKGGHQVLASIRRIARIHNEQICEGLSERRFPRARPRVKRQAFLIFAKSSPASALTFHIQMLAEYQHRPQARRFGKRLWLLARSRQPPVWITKSLDGAAPTSAARAARSDDQRVGAGLVTACHSNRCD